VLPDRDAYPLSSMLSAHNVPSFGKSNPAPGPLFVLRPEQLAGLGIDEMQLPAGGAGDGLICVITLPAIVREPGRNMNPHVGASE
jgi:hypothetical protein